MELLLSSLISGNGRAASTEVDKNINRTASEKKRDERSYGVAWYGMA